MKEFWKALHWLSLAAGFGVMVYCAFTAHSVFSMLVLLLYLAAWITTWRIMAGEEESMQWVRKEIYGTWVYGVHIILSTLACPGIVITLCKNIIDYNSIDGRSLDEVLWCTSSEIVNHYIWWYILMLIVFGGLIIYCLRKK